MLTTRLRITEIRSLATLLSAGLSTQQALESLLKSTAQTQTKNEVQQMLAQIRQGKSLSSALQSQRWCTPSRIHRLTMAEGIGALPVTLSQLASEREITAQRARYLWARLLGTLGLAFVTALVSAWLGSHKTGLSFWPHFLGTVPDLLILVLGAILLIWLVTRDHLFWACFAWWMPAGLGAARRSFEVCWVAALRDSLQAGVDPASATRQLSGLLTPRGYRAAMQAMSVDLSKGRSLSQATTHWRLSPRLRAAIQSGEAAGTLLQSLGHFVRLETQTLALTRQTFDEWLPRGFYLWAITRLMGFF